ncbi:hypothetical protein AB6A40_005154 [Gnathostoma spinigerum]|uniref:Uncharacterized protein n=1 Tax=Gnathostoma spinigerum TaxID=75299 RepID=A0ABD6EFR2_9BILA
MCTKESSRMEDYTTTNLVIPSVWHEKAPLKENVTQTEQIQQTDAGVDAIKRRDVKCQVHEKIDKADRSLIDRINPNVAEMILDILESNLTTLNIMNELNQLHSTGAARLILSKQFIIPEGENLPILHIESGRNGVIAILFGEKTHETWCLHNGRVLLWHRGGIKYIPLLTCPTVVRFGAEGLIAIGTVIGQICIVKDGELISSNEVHTLSVTAIEWLSSKSLVSTSLDGRIVVCSLKSTFTLRKERFHTFTVTNLPRKLRRSLTLTRPTVNTSNAVLPVVIEGITSMCKMNDRLFVGGETGAIWASILPDLTHMLITYEIGAIECLKQCSTNLVVLTSNGKVKIIDQNGSLRMEFTYQCSSFRIDRNDNIFLGTNEEIIVYSCSDEEEKMKEQMPNITFDIDDNKQLVLVQDEILRFYRIIWE